MKPSFPPGGRAPGRAAPGTPPAPGCPALRWTPGTATPGRTARLALTGHQAELLCLRPSPGDKGSQRQTSCNPLTRRYGHRSACPKESRIQTPASFNPPQPDGRIWTFTAYKTLFQICWLCAIIPSYSTEGKHRWHFYP